MDEIKIISSTNTIALPEYNIGQQFLVKEELRTRHGMKYNNIKIVFLTNKFMDVIYQIKSINVDVSATSLKISSSGGNKVIFEDVYYSPEEYTNEFLYLDNERNIRLEINEFYEEIVQLNYSGDDMELINDANILNEFFDIAKNEPISFKKIVNVLQNSVDFYIVYHVNGIHLCHHISNIISLGKLTWDKEENIYAIDNEFDFYTKIEFCNHGYNEMIIHLGEIENIRNSSMYHEVMNIYKGNEFDIKDYMKNPLNINYIYNTFSEISFLSKNDIDKFFKPIYIDESIDFISYVSSRFSIWDYSPRYICNDILDNKLIIDNNIRKSQSIIKYLKNNSDINVFNGDLLDEKMSIDYKDAGGMILKTNSSVNAYLLLDDIYVVATHNEERELLDRKKLVLTLENSK